MGVEKKVEKISSLEFLKALKEYLREDKAIESLVREIQHWKDIFYRFRRTTNILHYYVSRRKELERKIQRIMKNIQEIKKKKEGETRIGQELLRKLFLTLVLLKYLYDMNLLGEDAKKALRKISGIFEIGEEDKGFLNLVTTLFQEKRPPKVNLKEINGRKFLEVSEWGTEELYILRKVFGKGEIREDKFIIPFEDVEELVKNIGWILPRYINKRLEDVQRVSIKDILLSMGIRGVPKDLGELSSKVFERLFKDLEGLKEELEKVEEKEKNLKKELKDTIIEFSKNLKSLGNAIQMLSLFWILATLESGETVKEDLIEKLSKELPEKDIEEIKKTLNENLDEASKIATLYLFGIRKGWIDLSSIFPRGKEFKITNILRMLSAEKLKEDISKG